MGKPTVILALAAVLLVAAGLASAAAENRAELNGFKRIHGTAISKLMAGKEFSDGVHWRYSFQPSGALTEYSMSRRRDLHWLTKDDALCWKSARGEDCFEVWTSSTVLRLHPVGLGASLDGTLSRLVP